MRPLTTSPSATMLLMRRAPASAITMDRPKYRFADDIMCLLFQITGGGMRRIAEVTKRLHG